MILNDTPTFVKHVKNNPILVSQDQYSLHFHLATITSLFLAQVVGNRKRKEAFASRSLVQIQPTLTGTGHTFHILHYMILFPDPKGKESRHIHNQPPCLQLSGERPEWAWRIKESLFKKRGRRSHKSMWGNLLHLNQSSTCNPWDSEGISGLWAVKLVCPQIPDLHTKYSRHPVQIPHTCFEATFKKNSWKVLQNDIWWNLNTKIWGFQTFIGCLGAIHLYSWFKWVVPGVIIHKVILFHGLPVQAGFMHGCQKSVRV